MAGLDWRGVHQTDEDCPEGNEPTTYTRTRMFRGAKWMTRSSAFVMYAVDAHELPVGVPIVEVTDGPTISTPAMVHSCAGSWRQSGLHRLVRRACRPTRWHATPHPHSQGHGASKRENRALAIGHTIALFEKYLN